MCLTYLRYLLILQQFSKNDDFAQRRRVTPCLLLGDYIYRFAVSLIRGEAMPAAGRMLTDSCAGCCVTVCDTYMITLKLIPFLKLPLCPLTSARAEEEVRRKEKKNEAGDNRVNNLRARSGHCFLSRRVEQTIFREKTMRLEFEVSLWFVESIKPTVTDTRQKFPFSERNCSRSEKGHHIKVTFASCYASTWHISREIVIKIFTIYIW